MATLINVKQLDTSVSSSIVNGNLVITGSLTVTGSSIFASDISASRILGVDIDDVKGAFKIYSTYSELVSESVHLVSNNQIVWVDAENSLYQATVVPPDFSSSHVASVTWNDFSFPSETADITTTIAGAGLLPGGSVINIGAGDGILVTADAVSIDTGSLHFEDGVEKVVIVTTLDGGDI